MKRHQILLILAVFVLLAAGCGKRSETAITKAEQLNNDGIVIGVPMTTPEELVAKQLYPKARVDFYRDTFLGYQDVKNGKIDAYIYNKSQMELAIRNGFTGVKVLDETIGPGDQIAIGLSKRSNIPDLQEQVNALIKELKADGTLDDMYERWIVQNDYNMPEIEKPANPTMHLVVGTVGESEPFNFYEGATLTGLDIEEAYRFALWLNADLEFKIYDYSGIVSAAESGDVDCIMANLFVTEEKKETIPFSDLVYVEEVSAMVRDTGNTGTGVSGALASIAESFEKTFVRENRWQLFVLGIVRTLVITVCSVFFGTILGFIAYMLTRTKIRAASLITRFSIWLVQGMPIVVLLMIHYYVVFGRVMISALIVAIISFSMVFGADMYNMLRSGIGAIDKGQFEAAAALGYGRRMTFFRVILPQAMEIFMPSYKAAVIVIIKTTAVVGYIAVQDLTKVADIIRSRTYEAFFPLFAVAVIYFILGGLLTLLVNAIADRLDPKKRSPERILKGIKHD